MPPSNDHIVSSFDEELQNLAHVIARMGHMAVAQLDAALDVIECFDHTAADRVIANDAAIDHLEQSISHDVMRLALRGPLARDLREILVGIRVPTEIERVGDHAANVAKRARVLNAMPVTQQPTPGQIQGLRSLGKLAAGLVLRAVDAFERRDLNAALSMRQDDALLDAHYTAYFRELLTYMMEDPHSITACTHLLFMAKNLERVGDHATNIAENLWFLLNGEQPLPGRKKADNTSGH